MTTYVLYHQYCDDETQQIIKKIIGFFPNDKAGAIVYSNFYTFINDFVNEENSDTVEIEEIDNKNIRFNFAKYVQSVDNIVYDDDDTRNELEEMDLHVDEFVEEDIILQYMNINTEEYRLVMDRLINQQKQYDVEDEMDLNVNANTEEHGLVSDYIQHKKDDVESEKRDIVSQMSKLLIKK
jgi:hypothetical protein